MLAIHSTNHNKKNAGIYGVKTVNQLYEFSHL